MYGLSREITPAIPAVVTTHGVKSAEAEVAVHALDMAKG